MDPQILARSRYSKDDRRGRAGINQLLKKGVYDDAFPLHDGEFDYGDEDKNTVYMNHRRVRKSNEFQLPCDSAPESEVD